MTTTVTPTSTLPRLSLAGAFGGLFCGYVGLTAVIPVLPGYVRARYGAGDLLVGVVVTATALTALVTRPVAGGLADRHGYRRVMQVGALILAAGGAAYLLPTGVYGLVLLRFLLGIGEAALFTGGAVWVVSLAPGDRRAQLIGLYGMSMWAGISLGTLLGATLQRAGYDAVWLFACGVPLVGLLLVSLAPAPPHVRPAQARARLLLRPAVLPGTALALGAAGYAGLASFVVLALQARGIHPGVAVLSCFSAVYGGTRLVIGRLPDKYGPRWVACLSGLGEMVGLLVIAFAPNLAVALVGSVIMGVGFSLLHPSLALMVMNRTQPGQQGAALGAYTSFWDLGLAVWGPLTGVVASGLGYPTVFVVGAVCAGAAAAMAAVIGAPRPATAVTGDVA